MPFPLFETLSMFLSGTTIVGIIIAWKSRKSVIKQTEAEAMKAMQDVYDKMVDHTAKRFDEMDIEIKMVKQENYQFQDQVRKLTHIVEDYKRKCHQCVNNKQ